MAERGHMSQECVSVLAHRLESTVAHRFVKHSFKVLLHHVVDGPLQASRCLVLQSFNAPRSFIPDCIVYFGPKAMHNRDLIK